MVVDPVIELGSLMTVGMMIESWNNRGRVNGDCFGEAVDVHLSQEEAMPLCKEEPFGNT